MKWVWRAGVAAGGVLLAASLSTAQVPGGAPAGGAAVAGAPGAAAGVPGAAPAPAGFFAKMCAGIDSCRRKLCGSPAGQMLNNATKPLGAMTGGMFPPFCPIMPSLADLAKPGVAGASDAIKKDAIEAQMRRDKVRFLGTVDCRYYPDAIVALTAALRTDGSECVRYEAALALGHGCCCNQKTIDALDASVSGTEKDGNPAERSVRVRVTAANALERCLACYVPPPVEAEPVETKIESKGLDKALPPSPPGTSGKKNDAPPLLKLPEESGNTNKTKPVSPSTYNGPSRESVMAARRTLSEFHALLEAAPPQFTVSPPGERYSVYQIIKNSVVPPNSPIIPAGGSMAVNSSQSGPMAGRVTLGQPNAEPPMVASAGPVVGQGPPRPFLPDAMPTTPMPLAPKMPGAVFAPPSTPMMPTPPPPTSPVSAQTPSPIAPIIVQVINGSTAGERHAAIRQLVRFEWEKNPVVVSVLLAGAKNDPTPAVRVDCVRHLAAYHVTHPQVLADLGGLTQDSDAWVREEATRALAQLKTTP